MKQGVSSLPWRKFHSLSCFQFCCFQPPEMNDMTWWCVLYSPSCKTVNFKRQGIYEFCMALFLATMWRSPWGGSPGSSAFSRGQHSFNWIGPTEEWIKPGWNGIEGNCHQYPGDKGKIGNSEKWSSSGVSQAFPLSALPDGGNSLPLSLFNLSCSFKTMHISLQRNLEYTETQTCIEVFIISSSKMICYQITSFSIFFYVNKITKRKKKRLTVSAILRAAIFL